MNEKKRLLWPILTAAAIVLTAVLIGVYFWLGGSGKEAVPPVTPRPSQEVIVREREVERIVTVEREITAEILQDGVREVGMLITEEYYFTEVVSYSSIKQLFGIDLGITESSYMATYDGVVTAGVDLTEATVEKDEETHRVIVTLPHAVIANIDIDPESFVLHAEKAGLGNHISAEDFNSSLIELENTAREKALARGLLDRADENAHALVRNLIGSLIDLSEYTVVFRTVEEG